MSDLTFGIRDDEVPPAEDRVEQHIASGSGWEEREGHGGGHVPEGNPWKMDPPWKNPAQDGADADGLLHDEFQVEADD